MTGPVPPTEDPTRRGHDGRDAPQPPAEPPAGPPATDAPAPDPGALPPGAVPFLAPSPPAVPLTTFYSLLAVAGGTVLLGLLMAAAGVPPDVHVVVSFLGVVFLVVLLIIGAAGATDTTREGRTIMGVLAGLIVLVSVWAFIAAAQMSPAYATCGAIAAGPGLLALRVFTLLRNGYFVRHSDGTPLPAA